MFIQLEVSQPQWASSVSAVDEKFSECSTATGLGVLQMETGRDEDGTQGL